MVFGEHRDFVGPVVSPKHISESSNNNGSIPIIVLLLQVTIEDAPLQITQSLLPFDFQITLAWDILAKTPLSQARQLLDVRMNLHDLNGCWIDGLALISWHATTRAHKGRISVIPVEWNVIGCHGIGGYFLEVENKFQFFNDKKGVFPLLCIFYCFVLFITDVMQGIQASFDRRMALLVPMDSDRAHECRIC